MSDFLPHNATPEEHEVANAITSALFDTEAKGLANSLLTPAEQWLLQGLRLRVKARVRRDGFDDAPAYGQATQWVLAAAKGISDEPTS